MVPGMKSGVFLVLLFVGLSGFAAELDRPEFDFNVVRRQILKAAAEGRTNEALSAVRAEIKERPALFKLRALLGEVHEARREYADAAKAYGIALDLDPGADALFQRRGECLYRLGQLEEAVANFDVLLTLNPKDAPEHWQRGIALYQLGQFAEGRAQFESHRKVNGADCETALWHWLCVARVADTNAAIQAIIPYDEADIRPPMKQLHALYAGKGSVEDVLKAMDTPPEKNESLSEEGRKQLQSLGRFYGRLYLGLYYEAMGDKAKSLEWLGKAVESADVAGYMGDVAQVHLRRRTENK